MSYAELCTTTNFTFLHGASHPEEMVTRAAELGLQAIAITDRNSPALHWAVEFCRMCWASKEVLTSWHDFRVALIF